VAEEAEAAAADSARGLGFLTRGSLGPRTW
jgi:hypothetical protein